MALPEGSKRSLRGTRADFSQFGQVLETRRDLLPAAYSKERELLHDEMPPIGVDAARMTVESALGAPLTELFSSFEETPLAAAAIPQVHKAILQDGRRVAVEVQRPWLF